MAVGSSLAWLCKSSGKLLVSVEHLLSWAEEVGCASKSSTPSLNRNLRLQASLWPLYLSSASVHRHALIVTPDKSERFLRHLSLSLLILFCSFQSLSCSVNTWLSLVAWTWILLFFSTSDYTSFPCLLSGKDRGKITRTKCSWSWEGQRCHC